MGKRPKLCKGPKVIGPGPNENQKGPKISDLGRKGPKTATASGKTWVGSGSGLSSPKPTHGPLLTMAVFSKLKAGDVPPQPTLTSRDQGAGRGLRGSRKKGRGVRNTDWSASTKTCHA